MSERIVLDPTSESEPAHRPSAARPPTLDGVTVGLVDISKPRGNVFLDRLDAVLTSRGVAVRRYMKPTHARPAPADLRYRITTECGAVIQALAD
jgi:hypothetical protein